MYVAFHKGFKLKRSNSQAEIVELVRQRQKSRLEKEFKMRKSIRRIETIKEKPFKKGRSLNPPRNGLVDSARPIT